MKNKIFAVALTFCIAAGTVCCPAKMYQPAAAEMQNDEITADNSNTDSAMNYEYNAFGDPDGMTAEITRYLGTDVNPVIPSEIDGKKVTRIGSYAFSGCENIKEITVPSGVTSLEECAFKNCTSLSSITIPKSVKVIGEDAFYGCTSLKNITLPSGVKNIEEAAFTGCTALKKVVIGKNTVYIGAGAFNGCSSLGTIVIRSTKLTKVGDYAFRKIKATAKIKVPESRLEDYQKLLKGKGQGSRVKIIGLS